MNSVYLLKAFQVICMLHHAKHKHLGKLNNICIAYLHMCHASRYKLINQKWGGAAKKEDLYLYTPEFPRGCFGASSNSTITYTCRVHFFIGIPISKKTLEKSPLRSLKGSKVGIYLAKILRFLPGCFGEIFPFSNCIHTNLAAVGSTKKNMMKVLQPQKN